MFSIAIAEVIIVNMWETMVGLYNGANMGLLKTVLEVNLQLFGSKDSPKTLLCFVIRDFTSQTPLEALSQTIQEDLNKIWSDLKKVCIYFDHLFVVITYALISILQLVTAGKSSEFKVFRLL